ncbi:MAG: IclR family transcriptional regulator [Treponema sp.]|nr:IclR family transcriptional regulator [Treponema sp.]
MAKVIDDESKYNVKIVERCLSIFDLASALSRPFTVQDVMTHLDINVNMSYRLLATMVASGYLNKDETNSTYTLSLKVLNLSNGALSSLEIRKVALPYMEMLNQRFPNANVNLAVLYDGEIVQTDRIDSKVVPRTYFTPGKHIPFHASALGKVLVSEMYPEELECMIEKNGGLKEITIHTITDYEVLIKELKKVREQGYAVDRQELVLNDNCNAAPIRNANGKIIAAVSMSAFDNYISCEDMDKNIHFICETARQISYFMGYNV